MDSDSDDFELSTKDKNHQKDSSHKAITARKSAKCPSTNCSDSEEYQEEEKAGFEEYSNDSNDPESDFLPSDEEIFDQNKKRKCKNSTSSKGRKRIKKLGRPPKQRSLESVKSRRPTSQRQSKQAEIIEISSSSDDETNQVLDAHTNAITEIVASSTITMNDDGTSTISTTSANAVQSSNRRRSGRNITEKLSLAELQAQQREYELLRRKSRLSSSCSSRQATTKTSLPTSQAILIPPSKGDDEIAKNQITEEEILIEKNRRPVFTHHYPHSTVPLVHTTAWRKLQQFQDAPINVLRRKDQVIFEPPIPLEAYDPENKLKDMCRIIDPSLECVDATENNDKSNLATRVHQLVEEELPLLRFLHQKRSLGILTLTRKQLLKDLYYKKLRLVGDFSGKSSPVLSTLAEEKQLELIGSLAEQKRSEQAQSIARYMIGRPRTSLPSSGKSMFTHDDGTEETINDVVSVPMIHLEEVGYLGRIKTCIGLKTNYHVPNDPILRYVPYCEGVKGVIIDKCRYEKIEATIKRATCIEPKLELDEEIKECLLKEIVASFGATEQLFDTLKKLKPPVTYEDPASDYDRLKEMYLTRQGAMKQLLKLSQSPKNGVVRKLTSKLAIFEKHRVTDYLRPPISIFDSNLLKAPGCFGMRENSTYAEVAGSYSEIFCRLCYVYDCSMHGGQHPLPISRWDPVYPQAQYMPLKKHGIDTKAQEEIHRLGQLWYPTTATVSEGDASSNGSSLNKEDSGDYELSQEKDILLDLEQEEENDEEEDVEDHDDEDGEATDGDDFKTTTSLLEGRRRSERSQTRVSSLASAGLKIQLSMRDKRANCSKPPPKVKVHQLRAPYDSEYLDPTYIFTIGSTLKKIASPTEPCSSTCWKIEVMLPVASAMMWTKTEESILRKAITILEANACRLAVLFPARTCLEIYSFIQKEMAYQVKDKDFEEEEKNNEEEEVTVHSPSSIHKTQCGGRFRSNAKKKQSNRSIHQQREHSKRALLAEGGETCGYVPCDHIGPCLAGVCQCRKRNHLCSRACSCSRDCVYRLQGCTCLPGNCRTKACECFATDRECDPDFCLSCRACEIPLILRGDPSIQKKSSHSLGICNNVSLLRGLHKKIGMAFSTTHGYGAFALEPIEKDELVYEYTGALITDDEAERRGLLYDMTNMSFLFNVNKEYVVDAMRRGNKSKFANHNGNTPNCGAKIIRVVGDHRIALYAKKNIAKGEELFFDYGTTFHPTSNWEEAVNNKAKNDTNGDFNTPNIDLCGVAMKSSESVNMMTSATGISTPPKNSPVFLQQMNPFDVATNH